MLAPEVTSLKPLRDDQADAIERLRYAVGMGKRRIMMQAPTGWGKTVISSWVIDGALRKGGRVLFTVPAIQLVDQTVEVLYSQGVSKVGVIQADHPMTDYTQPVQIASVQTLIKRGIPEGFRVAIVDEAHKIFDIYAKRWFFEEAWRKVPIIGLSATPWTRGLGKLYEQLIIAGTTRQLIDQGVLSKFRVFAPSKPDLTGVRTVAGDYHEGDLSAAMNKAALVGDVVEHWSRLARWQPTIVFAVDCAHAKALADKFTAAGVPAAYQDATTPDGERKRIKNDFHSGNVSVVCSVGTLIVGVDWDVRCIVWARPTKSEMLFVQGTGRGLRTAPGKEECLILDHSDNHARLGFVTDIMHEELDAGTKKRSGTEQGPALPKDCPKCAYMMPPRIVVCPNCGFERKVTSRVKSEDGELAELKPRARLRDVLAKTDRRKVWCSLKYLQEHNGYALGWVAHRYREIFGVWPQGVSGPPQKPDAEFMAWYRTKGEFWKMVARRRSGVQRNFR